MESTLERVAEERTAVPDPAEWAEFDPAQLLAPRLSRRSRAVLDALQAVCSAPQADDSRPANRVSARVILATDNELEGLEAIGVQLLRLRGFALCAANGGTACAAQTAADQFEADAAIDAINRIAARSDESAAASLLSADNLGTLALQGTVCTLADLASGGCASLSRDPRTALQILRQAKKTVEEQTARLTAFRREVLGMNLHALEATVVGILRTESFLRDAETAMACAAQAGTTIRDGESILRTQDAPDPETVFLLLAQD